MITSEDNAIVKQIRKLSQRKHREESGQFVIEGVRFLTEALQHHSSIDTILYSDGLLKVNGGEALFHQLQGRFQLVHLAEPLFNKLSETQNPQGVMAVMNRRPTSLEQLLKKQNLFLVLLDRIQDPGNLGTIIRTANGAGADGILLTKGCVDPYNGKVLRATMGAIFHVPLLEVDEAGLQQLKERGVRFIAADLQTKTHYHTPSYGGSIALVLGNEANGVDPRLLEISDEIVKIPIVGAIESLNASVAAGILLYKALESRSGGEFRNF